MDSLTPREQEVLRLMAEGRSNTGIAEALKVSHSAVEKYISNIFTKLDLPPTGHRAPPGPGRPASSWAPDPGGHGAGRVLHYESARLRTAAH